MLAKMVVPISFSIRSIIEPLSSLVNVLIGNDNIVRLEECFDASYECGCCLLHCDIV